MQVFPLNLQYQKVLSDFFKKNSVKAYEFHLMSNPIGDPPCEPIKYWKTSSNIKYLIAIELYL